MNRAVLAALALLATTLAASAQQLPGRDAPIDGGSVGSAVPQQESPAPSNKPLASIPAADLPGVHTDILSLKRTEGGLLTMQLAFVNDSDGPVKATSFPGSGDPLTDSIVLIDYGGRNKYPIIHFSDGSCLCTTKLSVYAEFPPNSTKTAWAKFTAPSAAVKKVSILFPGGEPIDDVPITDKDGSGTLVKDRNTGSPPSLSKATHPRSGKTSL